MNNKFIPVKTGFFAVCGILFMSGCEKGFDHGIPTGDDDLKLCNIQKITAYEITYNIENPVDTIIYTFAYNKLGDPVSVLHGDGGTGNPNYLFTYDKYHRLTQFLRTYSNGDYEQWDKYDYNAKGQIVRDTNYIFGVISLPSPRASYRTYKYDPEDRLIHETDSNYLYGNFIGASLYDYSYDAKGNLVNGAVYDNKLNINRTNKIWMFIAKDYSVNNPYSTTKYNEYGLPVDFTVSGLGILPAIYGGVKVDYLCR